MCGGGGSEGRGSNKLRIKDTDRKDRELKVLIFAQPARLRACGVASRVYITGARPAPDPTISAHSSGAARDGSHRTG